MKDFQTVSRRRKSIELLPEYDLFVYKREFALTHGSTYSRFKIFKASFVS